VLKGVHLTTSLQEQVEILFLPWGQDWEMGMRHYLLAPGLGN
jgi:hypothetical protein